MRKTTARTGRKNSTSWKKYVLMLVMMVFAGGLLALYRAVKISHFLSRDWRTTVVFNTNPVVVAAFPKSPQDATALISLPPKATIKVPYGYGAYRIEAIWRLSELEERPDLFAEAISDLVGSQVSGWVRWPQTRNLSANNPAELTTNMRNLLNPLALLQSNYQTNLALLDRLILSLKLFQLKHDNTLVYLTHENARLFATFEPVKDLSVLGVNEGELDVFLQQILEESDVRRDHLRVAVFNTTKTAGLGNAMARYISNFGGNIVRVDNTERATPRCEVYAHPDYQHHKLVRFLEQEFQCWSDASVQANAADVEIYVGDWFANRWGQAASP